MGVVIITKSRINRQPLLLSTLTKMTNPTEWLESLFVSVDWLYAGGACFASGAFGFGGGACFATGAFGFAGGGCFVKEAFGFGGGGFFAIAKGSHVASGMVKIQQRFNFAN